MNREISSSSSDPGSPPTRIQRFEEEKELFVCLDQKKDTDLNLCSKRNLSNIKGRYGGKSFVVNRPIKLEISPLEEQMENKPLPSWVTTTDPNLLPLEKEEYLS